MYTANDKKIYLNVPKEFRNRIWANQMGDFYSLLRKKEIERIVIDFSKCEWADPIPVLSLLTCIKQYTTAKKENISFILPEKQNTDQLKLLKFLYTEGFISIFCSLGTIQNDRVQYIKRDVSSEIEDFTVNTNLVLIEEFEDIEVDLNYFDCSLFPATIFNFKSESKIDDIVEYVMTYLSANLKAKKLNDKQLNSLTYKLKMFINETLHNIFKHAYSNIDSKEKYGALYVRFRHGLENTSINSIQRREILRLLYKELDLKLLDTFLLETREGCLEVFVIDAGKGISETLKRKRRF